MTQTLQNDPNVKMPAAVLAASARSDQMYNQYRDQPITSAGNEQPAEQPAEQQGEQPAEQAQQGEQPPMQQPPQSRPDEESWEHKYKSVHGRFVRQQEQMRAMSDEIANLQGVIATMQIAPSNSDIPPELRAERLITDDEARDYGEDFLKVVGKKAKEELVPIIQQQAAEIAELKRMMSGVTSGMEQDNKQKMLDALDKKLPRWRELNTDQNFISWLRLPDPFSGAIRHNMLKAAFDQGNANRVLAFFNGFLAEEAVVAPARGEPDTQGEMLPKVPLENLAAPGRAKSAAGNAAPAEKPIFTRAHIAAFYADVAAGKYRGKDAEKAKNEAMIFEAQREGRIR